jgi:hypothetical protein
MDLVESRLLRGRQYFVELRLLPGRNNALTIKLLHRLTIRGITGFGGECDLRLPPGDCVGSRRIDFQVTLNGIVFQQLERQACLPAKALGNPIDDLGRGNLDDSEKHYQAE